MSNTTNAGTQGVRPVLAPFSGMKVNIESSLRSPRNDKLQKWARGELADNLMLLAKAYYEGRIGVVDEFLQLYCLGKEERAALVARNAEESKEEKAPS